LDKGKDEGKADKIDFEKIRQNMRLSTQNTLKALDEARKARWSWARGDRNVNMGIFRAIVEENAGTAEQVINLFEMVTDLRKAILLLNNGLEAIEGKIKEIEGLHSKIEDILKNPVLLEVHKFIKDLEDRIEKQQKMVEQYRV
jgi:hypothetical protein